MSHVNPGAPDGGRQPIFLVPGVVAVLVGLLWAIHVSSTIVLDNDGLGNLRIWFGFLPLRITHGDLIPGGMLPLAWSGFTHALLHVDYTHLLLNSAWLAIFGTPVARRYGTWPMLAVFFLGALGGALLLSAHYLMTVNQYLVLIGASGGVSALTGTAVRFIFQPVIVGRHPETGEPVVLGRRTARLGEMLANVRVRTFVLVWLGLNLAIPLAGLFDVNIAIAWEAHIGGFIVGLILPGVFERGRRE